MTTLAEEDFVGSATEVAVTVASEGLGMVAGAVYKPADVIVPHEPDTHPIPETVQLTVVLDEPVTLAVNCCWPLTVRVTEVGEIATETLAAVAIVTCAIPVCDGSKRETAVTVTLGGVGAVDGAV